ncbi:acetolactate synthase-1/2/3 large subunit [Pseudorhodobacter antarcticus]|uniref:Acetolactate synthase-1/2/3 large subunit n=1 Tax=Pseudorhodobacter antarcticus TaxID=1077947 RepID=A0A1H8B496_9RHOB|nr:5-guanidino-2-oxopentanoate decarboxylase [Pseudorhodobacter antarcticus]SEM77745.1 acetolactate synthase-1/2/3 large subunit [Pseudorhodobacter antarcticus]
MTTVGEALTQGLRARGVEVVFGIPGVHTIELYRGLAGSGMRHVTPRHEQGAGFMADGYARVSGRPGVAFVITGPGVTNTLTAMAQARADSVPMLVISGVNRRGSLGLGMGALHELPDQAGLVGALCPSFQVTSPEVLEQCLDRAFAAMLGGRPGPVHIEVPVDVMGMAAVEVGAPLPVPVAAPCPDLVAQAVGWLAAARRPVILAGGGARRADVAGLAAALDAPVVQTVNGRGICQGTLSVAASPSLDAVRALIAASDQVLAIGTEFGPTDYDMYVRGGFPDVSGMIRVDICGQQLARHQARVVLQGDAAAVVAALIAGLPARAGGDGAARAQASLAAARAEVAGLGAAMPGQIAMLEALRDAVPGAIVVGDSTQPVYAGNLLYDHDRAGGWFNAATGYGALGFATGAAVGAAIAAPDARVFCLIGDGGLQFSPAELRVAVDEGLDITYLVWNNAGYGEIADAMRAAGTEVIGCAPSPLGLEAFARACDLPYVCIAPDAAQLAAAVGARGPRLIEIRDY